MKSAPSAMRVANTEMSFVLDASITLCWAFDDESHATATVARDRLLTGEAYVPALWWFEVRNGLVMAERRGRRTSADTAAFLSELVRLGVRIDRSPGEATVLALAREYDLTVYDASYLELAQREALDLATLDADLRKAANALDIPLVG